jgi:hypothetical protein
MGPVVINGLPAHILLVHVVIVAVPVAAALVIVAAVSPAARRWLNWLPAFFALAALIAVPITTHAGHWLEHHLRGSITPAIAHHVALGNQMLPWVLALFIASLLVWLMARLEGQRSLTIGQARGDQASVKRGGWLKIVIAIVAVAAAIGATQQVYRTAEAGSRAVWSGTFAR